MSVTFAAANAYAQTHTAPIIVELFTSKYCPACPTADKNFNTLIGQNPNIIGLSCHVTYFNRATRFDKLAKPFCDARQGVYKQILKSDKVFTPMMVIHGQSFTTGLKPEQTRNLIKKISNVTPTASLTLNGRYVDIRLPQVAINGQADVWLLEVEKQRDAAGYTHYRNSVRKIQKLLSWSGKPMNMAFPVFQKPNSFYVLIAQNAQNGIIAAASTTH